MVDGIAMGFPDPPSHGSRCVYKLNKPNIWVERQPKTFFFYFDDCFDIFSEKSEIAWFFNKLNQIHTQIQFTAQYETKDQLSFLDVLIEKGTDNDLWLPVYHKPTIHWTL